MHPQSTPLVRFGSHLCLPPHLGVHIKSEISQSLLAGDTFLPPSAILIPPCVTIQTAVESSQISIAFIGTSKTFINTRVYVTLYIRGFPRKLVPMGSLSYKISNKSVVIFCTFQIIEYAISTRPDRYYCKIDASMVILALEALQNGAALLFPWSKSHDTKHKKSKANAVNSIAFAASNHCLTIYTATVPETFHLNLPYYLNCNR